MPTTAWEEATRAELFVRSDLPTPVQHCRESAVSRLEQLVERNALAEFSVASWAKRVPVAGDSDVGSFERERYETFTSWARTAGVSLSPFFDTRECYSWTTGDRQTQLVLPAACLALYVDDELVGVAPHVDGSGTVGIQDCLERLADVESDGEPSVPLSVAD